MEGGALATRDANADSAEVGEPPAKQLRDATGTIVALTHERNTAQAAAVALRQAALDRAGRGECRACMGTVDGGVSCSGPDTHFTCDTCLAGMAQQGVGSLCCSASAHAGCTSPPFTDAELARASTSRLVATCSDTSTCIHFMLGLGRLARPAHTTHRYLGIEIELEVGVIASRVGKPRAGSQTAGDVTVGPTHVWQVSGWTFRMEKGCGKHGRPNVGWRVHRGRMRL